LSAFGRPYDDALAVALAAGRTLTEAAQAAGVSERTARRRWADADFRRRVSDLRGELMAEAAGRLAGSMTRAADRLAELVESKEDRTALAAAKAILGLGLLAREKLDNEALVRELQERLERIEADSEGGDWR
jgi:hypothetical protein